MCWNFLRMATLDFFKMQKYLTGLGSQNHSSVPEMEILVLSIQDILHLINKLRNRILNACFPLVIGQTLIPVMRDLELFIQKISRGVHGFSINDIDTSDKMNTCYTLLNYLC